jgi:hypothetical protein
MDVDVKLIRSCRTVEGSSARKKIWVGLVSVKRIEVD